MAYGVKGEFSPAEVNTLMKALFDSPDDEAAELHDKIARMSAEGERPGRFYPETHITFTVWPVKEESQP